MTQLVRWEPFFRDFDTLFRRFGPIGRGFNGELEESFNTWQPPVDIYDDGDAMLVQAELPGMRPEDFDIRVENNVMVLSGERRREREHDDSGYYRTERRFGRFTRYFTLPTVVDVTQIDASYKDGILTVRLPKIAEARPRRIDVKVA